MQRAHENLGKGSSLADDIVQCVVGLYNIILAAALEGNGHASYRSRHNKVDLTSVVTTLLVQVDSAVSTTHQCLSKEVTDKDGR